MLVCGAMQAQKNGKTAQEPLRTVREELMLQRNPRVPAINPKWAERMSATPDTKGAAKGSTSGSLPANRWFPGEWEEVQAICVTWPYDCHPLVDGAALTSQYAEPYFSGVGYYYRTANDYMNDNSYDFGPIVGVPDTSGTSFMLVFANLINAIQQGNAEAWVNVWQYSDTLIIKRVMTRLGMPMTRYRWIQSYGNSFWYRDCGPICFYYGDQDSVGMLDFMYYPGRALDDSLPYAIEAQMGIPNWETTIEWEGGNCLVDGTGMCISSNAIYSNNSDSYGQMTWDGSNESSIRYTTKRSISNAAVRDSLKRMIGTRATYVLPQFRYDGGTGHIDLYADMWDENEFVFSKFPERYSSWTDYKTAAKNIDSMCSYTSVFGNKYKKHYIPFPRTNNGGYFTTQASYNDNYTRTYSNHTFVNNVIVQPCFSNVVNGEPSSQWDKRRIDTLKAAYPGYTIYPINVASFDGSGGAIHCITKQIPAENPVRILHPSITGNTENAYYNTDAPITATITNRSGIQSAKVVYRVDGGTWNEVALTAGSDNSYSGSIPTSGITVGEQYTTIEYYISATSNNGKTITKPMTAGQGGYYTFYLGHNDEAAIAAPEEAEAFGEFYPNPSNGLAHVRIAMAEGSRYTVQVVDMAGQTVHQSQLTVSGDIVYTIDTQKLHKGVYSVVFTANDGTRTVRRIVVQ